MQDSAELILVVDDSHEIVSIMINNVLPRCGYRGMAASTGAQALDIIQTQHPDVVLLDIELPDVNGLDLVEQLRDQSIQTPIIMMTAYGSEETAVRAFRLGVRDYLIKPFTADQAAAAISKALYVARLEREKDRLTQQLQQRIQELTVLQHIGKSVASVLELDTLLNRIVEAAVVVTRAEGGFLMLLDEETHELYLRAEQELEDDQAHPMRLKVTDSLLGQVVSSGHPLRLGPESGPDETHKVATGCLVRALLHVPLIAHGQVIGVLSVHNRTAQRAFSENHLERLSALADYAVIALQNARLHEALKERADQLEAAYADLEEMSRLKTQFVHNVTHEIRAPLTFIKGYVDLLTDGTFGEVESEQLKPLGIVSERTDWVARLVDDILTLHQLESESPELEQVDLLEIAQAAVDGAWASAQGAGLVVSQEVPKSLTPIMGDPGQLVRVFDNLLSNAIKFTPDGGKVTVHIFEEDDHVNVHISDTGIGIPPEKLEHLFSRFYRTGDVKHATGTGLGLTIVKTIVEAHGGKVTVHSREGQGSIFSFSLPKHSPKARPVSLPASLERQGTSPR
jgi:signal transduction histidine kinase